MSTKTSQQFEIGDLVAVEGEQALVVNFDGHHEDGSDLVVVTFDSGKSGRFHHSWLESPAGEAV